jgi:pyrrolidone-carboxylate peptidase
VRAFPRRRGLKKIVFPVRFHKGQFTGALKDFRPDVVLGLGQCSRGSLLRQERRAVNRRRTAKDQRPTRILRDAPAALFTNLHVNLEGGSKWSQDAGNYVCNFSMYVMLDYIRRRKLPVLYGFVHVPRGYEAKRAVRILRRALATLASSTFNVQRPSPFPLPEPRGGRGLLRGSVSARHRSAGD